MWQDECLRSSPQVQDEVCLQTLKRRRRREDDYEYLDEESDECHRVDFCCDKTMAQEWSYCPYCGSELDDC